jgi:hypothetical protein
MVIRYRDDKQPELADNENITNERVGKSDQVTGESLYRLCAVMLPDCNVDGTRNWFRHIRWATEGLAGGGSG